jgi:hypothetical protein
VPGTFFRRIAFVLALVLLMTMERVDLLARTDVHLALERPGSSVCAALPDCATDLSLDALDDRMRDVVLLGECVHHFLDGEAGALPLDAVDRATGENGRERNEQSTTTKHGGSVARVSGNSLVSAA